MSNVTVEASATMSLSEFANFITGAGVENKQRGEVAGSGGKSWLVALAGGMGAMIGDRAVKMMELMDKMESLNKDLEKLEGKEDQASRDKREQNTREFQQVMTEFQAESQMFNILSNTSSTSIKSIGEGLTAIARKQ